MLRKLVQRGMALGWGTGRIPRSWSGLRNEWTDYVAPPHTVERWLGPAEPANTHGVTTRVRVTTPAGTALLAAGACPPTLPHSAACAPAQGRGRGVVGGGVDPVEHGLEQEEWDV